MKRVILAISLVLMVQGLAFAQAPSWNVDPRDFENSMTVTAILSIENNISNDPNDLVAAFVNGQIRGVAQPTIDVPSTGQKVAFLQIYSNQSGGENISFKIYRASSNEIIDAVTLVAFSSNASLGTNSDPFVISDNQPPSDLLISNTVIPESTTLNSQVALFFAQDNDIGEIFSYQLTAGNGDDDNGKFSIIGNGLILQAELDYESDPILSIRVRTVDSKNAVIVKIFELRVSDSADGPTDITLESTTINENSLTGTLISALQSTDQDENDTFTYSLIDDAGGSFYIQANQLFSNQIFNFEDVANYSVTIRTTDASGLSFDKTVVITINDVNDAPTALLLDNDSIGENFAVNSFVGLLSTVDEDVPESTSFSFIRGNNDNANFLIAGDSLKTFAVFNHEENDIRLVEIKATDASGATIDRRFQIKIKDTNDPSTEILLEGNSLAENQVDSLLIGTFSTVDEDEVDTYTYTLVNGLGSQGNEYFFIENNELKSNVSFDYEEQQVYSIRVQVTDQSGVGPQEIFTIQIEDANDQPTELSIDRTSIAENLPIGSLIGVISTVDEDSEDEFIYELLADSGNAFLIDGNQLKSNQVFNFEQIDSYSISVKTTDKGGLSFDKDFIITITDANDAPTALNLSSTNIEENKPSTTLVGILSTVDVDAVESTSYSFINGNNDNANFFIAGDSLRSFQVFNHEETPTLLVEISARDKGSERISRSFVINVLDDNDASINIILDRNLISENSDVGTEVGEFFTQDEDINDDFTYSLVPGIGSSGNTGFQILDNVLYTDSIFDFEQNRLVNIRVRVEDQSGTGPEQVFGILIEDRNDAPTDILVSNLLIEENRDAGTVIGTLSTLDQDAGESFIYELASGEGDLNNGDFLILNNQLITRKQFNFEERNRFSLRLRTIDASAASFAKTFEVIVEDVNESPEIVPEQEFSVYEDEDQDALVGQVLVEDPDDIDFHFTILEDDVPFYLDSITGEIFIAEERLDFEKENFYELSILVEDSLGLSDIQAVKIFVIDVIEAELPANNFVSDNDDAKNDVFFIQNVDLYSEYTLNIFNSSGVLVYRKINYSNNWSGKALNGKLLPEGIYQYVFSGPGNQEFKGIITLVR